MPQEMLELDDLIFDAEADPVLRALNKERARLQGKFTVLIEEVSEQEINVGNINTLSDAADLILTVRGYYHRTQAIFGEAISEKRQAQIRRDASKTKAQAKISELIRSDPEVRGVAGQQAQMARAENKAKSELALASGCNDLYLLVMGYTERLQVALENLKQASRDLHEYIRTVRDAKALGESGSGGVPEGAQTGRVSWT
jgi:hypothetical protein